MSYDPSLPDEGPVPPAPLPFVAARMRRHPGGRPSRAVSPPRPPRKATVARGGKGRGGARSTRRARRRGLADSPLPLVDARGRLDALGGPGLGPRATRAGRSERYPTPHDPARLWGTVCLRGRDLMLRAGEGPARAPRPRCGRAPAPRRPAGSARDGETARAARAWLGGGRRSSAGAPLRADRRRCGGEKKKNEEKNALKKTAPQPATIFLFFFSFFRRGGGIGFFRATRSNAALSGALAGHWATRMAPGPARGLSGACPGPVRGLHCGGPGWNVISFFLFSFARGADAARPIGREDIFLLLLLFTFFFFFFYFWGCVRVS